MSKMINTFLGKSVRYIETTYPNADAKCDVYVFDGDSSRDLAIVRLKPRGKTPRQRVLLGERTVEGYMSGEGMLNVNGTSYVFPHAQNQEVEVTLGDVMQWQAGDEGLVFYELCTPPYGDGRFEDLA